MTLKTNIQTKKSNNNVRELVVTSMFTAVICVMSQLSIQIQPIPFTLSLFAIFLTGALLPPRSAFLATLTYLLLGAFGLPVFAGFKGGIQILAGMTGGYLVAYPVMAFLISIFYKYLKKFNKILSLTIGMLVALIFCYTFGTIWFTFITDTAFYTALTLCVFPFLLFDLAKIVFAIIVSIIIRKTVFNHNNL